MEHCLREAKYLKYARLVPVLLVSVILWYFLGAYPRGMIDATRDHMLGRYKLQTYGFPICIWNEDYCILLKQRYGVEVVQNGDCAVFLPDKWYADGYNYVSELLLNRKFGKNIFQECSAASTGGSP